MFFPCITIALLIFQTHMLTGCSTRPTAMPSFHANMQTFRLKVLNQLPHLINIRLPSLSGQQIQPFKPFNLPIWPTLRPYWLHRICAFRYHNSHLRIGHSHLVHSQAAARIQILDNTTALQATPLPLVKTVCMTSSGDLF